MKLYDLPRNTWFTLMEAPQVPPASYQGAIGEVYKLQNIDGMYSHCTDKEGYVYHFAAWTEVVVVPTPQNKT